MYDTQHLAPVVHSVEPFFVSVDATILDAIRAIDAGTQQIALAVDADRRLLGVVTDGDIRRAILRGIELSAPLDEILNRTPVVCRYPAPYDELAKTLLGQQRITRLPAIDAQGRVVGLYRTEDLLDEHFARDFPVVLMAGGLGTRLRPFTDTIPKPMIDVGGRPILEHIIRRFVSQGFKRFYVSVNYLSHVIKDYFATGEAFGAEIHYLEETERLGTAGSLRLLPHELEGPFFVMNGDLLTAANFAAIADYHLETGAEATMCLREYTVQVPYGVVEQNGGRFVGIEEKPMHRHYVNSGIYVLNASILSLLPENGYFDMPSLFDGLMKKDPSAAAVFPLREYWCDIGQVSDLERARSEIARLAVF
ncbi:nucleotidyltransferase family protein [Ciceribacter sp. RN22]|uniref:nucleotidyltransferase family protein n=1 Tax=Ciceribacter sp. RN22 TaxID=2954932 RepID=UPI0020939DE4|nr:nucleotidyltransferase family protein [Ciceribacter sp. RN22]MCO6179018.1 nucleotidyltransferase family protein [Ciceribacter sp. RN22]